MKTNLLFLGLFALLAYLIYQNRKRISDLQAAQVDDQKLFQFAQITAVAGESTDSYDYAGYYKSLISA